MDNDNLFTIIIAAIGIIGIMIIAAIINNTNSQHCECNCATDNQAPIYAEPGNIYGGSINKSSQYFNDTISIFSCPENQTLVDVLCDCQKNTRTPCMAQCYECQNYTQSIFSFIDYPKKNVTCLSSESENSKVSSFIACSNNLSMPSFLVSLGNDTYAFKLPYKYVALKPDYTRVEN